MREMRPSIVLHYTFLFFPPCVFESASGSPEMGRIQVPSIIIIITTLNSTELCIGMGYPPSLFHRKRMRLTSQWHSASLGTGTEVPRVGGGMGPI